MRKRQLLSPHRSNMIGYSKTKQIGKKKKTQTQINAESNKALNKLYKSKKKYKNCELRIAPNCLPRQKMSYGEKLSMTYAHRHKRDWYKSNNRMYLLSSFNQTIRCCLPCHMMIEADNELTKKVFLRHRPDK